MFKISLLFSLFVFSSSFNFDSSPRNTIAFHLNPKGTEKIIGIQNNFEDRLIKLINTKRIKRGLNALIPHKDLMRASRYHAADMANEDYHEHTTHNRTKKGLQPGLSAFKRISKFYDGFANTENIGAGYATPEAILQGWIDSPGHNENLFNESATHVGVGYYENPNSSFGKYWVFESAVE